MKAKTPHERPGTTFDSRRLLLLTAAEMMQLSALDVACLLTTRPAALSDDLLWAASTTQEKTESGRRWATLPPGQRQAVDAYVGSGECTIAAAAKVAGISPNTLKTHLQRIRVGEPKLWTEIQAVRKRHLAQRHARALERDEAHSREWHRRQANRRYRERFGCWPWEPRW